MPLSGILTAICPIQSNMRLSNTDFLHGSSVEVHVHRSIAGLGLGFRVRVSKGY